MVTGRHKNGSIFLEYLHGRDRNQLNSAKKLTKLVMDGKVTLMMFFSFRNGVATVKEEQSIS